jgi:hypothetical protein
MLRGYYFMPLMEPFNFGRMREYQRFSTNFKFDMVELAYFKF